MAKKTQKGKSKAKSPDRTWRDFEKFVARVEHSLHPKGAVVELDVKLPDIFTGDLRQVDATIRFKVGSVNILIAIECRKRASKENVLWIEQLESKKRSIGANELLAVSPEGFTDYAKRKAALCGISLRKMEKVNPSKLLDPYIFEIREGRYQAQDILFKFSETARPLQTSVSNIIHSEVFLNSTEAVIWSSNLRTTFTRDEFVKALLHSSTQQGKGLDVEHDWATLEIDFTSKDFFFRTSQGDALLDGVTINFTHFEKRTTIDDFSKYDYKDGDDNLFTEVIEFEHVRLNGDTMLFRGQKVNK